MGKFDFAGGCDIYQEDFPLLEMGKVWASSLQRSDPLKASFEHLAKLVHCASDHDAVPLPQTPLLAPGDRPPSSIDGLAWLSDRIAEWARELAPLDRAQAVSVRHSVSHLQALISLRRSGPGRGVPVDARPRRSSLRLPMHGPGPR